MKNNIENKKLTAKDAFMLIKALSNVADSIYKCETDRFVHELEASASHEYRSEYGLLSLRAGKPKTVKTYTDEELVEADKIQKQIKKLKAQLDKLGTEIVTDSVNNSLVAHLSETAEEDASNLLETVINQIDSKLLARIFKRITQ